MRVTDFKHTGQQNKEDYKPPPNNQDVQNYEISKVDNQSFYRLLYII